MRPTRVLLVHPYDVVRVGVAALLDRDQHIHVVGAAASGERGLELIITVRPDVTLVCDELPRMSGVDFCRLVTTKYPHVGVLILSLDAKDVVLNRALSAGARGFLQVGIGADDLRRAVREVGRGRAVLDPAVAGRVIGWARHRTLDRHRSLSPRETEVMRLVSRGASDAHIASALGVSPNTVKTYLRRSLDKLGCQSRSEAAVAAARRGLS